MNRFAYTIKLPSPSNAIFFVNGIIARNFKGWLWLMRNLFWIRQSVKKSAGCIQSKSGLCNIKEVVMISYWQDEEALKLFFKSPEHRTMMKYFSQNPNSLSLYNETYKPHVSGKYTNEPNGLALLYQKD